MRNRLKLVSIVALLTLPLAACGDGDDDGGGGDDAAAPPEGSGVCGETDASGDALADICERGEITVSTDPAYPPQSSLNKKTGDYEGFDIDVATEIATRLGVKVAWEAPSWEVITAGSWNNRWQMSVGSMTPTNDRQEVLNFTQPYYYTPAVVVVHESNSDITDLETDLDGKKVGVCSGCTYDQFLSGDLEIEGFTFDFIVDDAEVSGYDTDTTALQDLGLGDGTRLDAVITSLTTAQGFADAGNPVKIVGEPVFYEPLAVATDKSSEADPASLSEAIDGIVGEMHEDGTLTEFSEKWYDGIDLSKEQ